MGVGVWTQLPNGDMENNGWIRKKDGTLVPPTRGLGPSATPTGRSPASLTSASLAADILDQRAQIIDRWNATYLHNQVAPKDRDFLLKNPSAFAGWYKRANAQQAKMGADFPAMASTSYAGTFAGEPTMTKAEQDSYGLPGTGSKRPKSPKMKAGMTGADINAMRVARDLAQWK